VWPERALVTEAGPILGSPGRESPQTQACARARSKARRGPRSAARIDDRDAAIGYDTFQANGRLRRHAAGGLYGSDS
jgi:hypothetical protein